MKKFFLLIISIWALYLMIALFSYNPFDPSWFQSTWPIYIYNKAGNIGAFLADLLFVIFGVVAYFIPFFIVMIYWNIFAQINSINFFILSFKLIGISILLLSLCGLVTLIFKDFNYFGSGGIIGDIVSRIIFLWCCGKGVVYYLLFILIIGILLITNFSLPIFIKKIFNYLIIDSLLNIYKRYYVKKNNNYFLYLYIMNRKLIIISFKKKIIKFKVFSFFYPINKKFVKFKFHTVPYVFVFMDSNYIQILDENIVCSKFDYSCFLISYRIFCIKNIFSIIELNTFLKNSVSDIIYNNIFKKKIFLTRNNIFCKVKEFSYSTYIAYNYGMINNNILSKRHLDNNELIFDNIYYANKLISQSSIQQRKSYKKQKIISDIPISSNFSKKINKIALPSLKKNNQDSCLDNIAKLIELKLAEYQIKAHVENILSGPVVTRFELNLAAGIKVVNVINISRDLARSLSVSMVKVIETIPGKPYIGLEIPNNKRQMVSFQELLNCDEFRYANSPLTLILGKNIIGQPVVNDLKNLIHILIAGTTGSGKSVGINVIILSLLYKATPEEVRLILIDPKMLELSVYTGIPHLLMEVVTDMKDVDNILHWCIKEMEYRYKLMSIIGVRNLASYNEQVSQSFYCHCPINNPLYNGNENCLQSSKKILNKLPYIVVIIDEFSDLIMVSGKKIEKLIIKLTQKSRAAGIYLILTTQRPSINVITGLIKANIPTRIAFSVSSKVDSRIILDQNGAEMLLGMGDMLYLPAYSSIPIRVHGAFVQDKEIQEIIKYWKYNTQEKYTYHTINILNKRS